MATADDDNNLAEPRWRDGPLGASQPARHVDQTSHDAIVQEMKAGAAPLVRIVPISARIRVRQMPARFSAATVPFLTVSAVRWSKVTVGDTIGRLVQLLQEHGGIWLAQHTTATLTWTVSPAAESTARPETAQATAKMAAPTTPWVRVDAAFTGAWTGRFALAGSAPRLAASLWCLAASPLVGILPDEAADAALPAVDGDRLVDWPAFTEALDNVVHVTGSPSEAIRDLVTRSAWPGADVLNKHD